jgi:hypothetical protein
MPKYPTIAFLLCPTTIPIHNNGDMLRDVGLIQIFRKLYGHVDKMKKSVSAESNTLLVQN